MRVYVFAILVVLITGCAKQEMKMNRVDYKFICDKCTVVLDRQNKLNDTVDIVGFYGLSEMNNLKQISISTIGSGLIKSKLLVNGNIFHDQSVNQHGETLHYTIQP